MLERLELERNLRYNGSAYVEDVLVKCEDRGKGPKERERDKTIRNVCSTSMWALFCLQQIRYQFQTKYTSNKDKGTAKKREAFADEKKKRQEEYETSIIAVICSASMGFA